MWEDKLWQNNRVVVVGKGVQAESFLQNRQNQPVGREETFLRTFLNNHVIYFSIATFCGSFRKSWSEIPRSSRCFVVPRTRKVSDYLTRWKLEIVRNYFVDLRQTYLVSKQKFVKVRGYETYNTKKVKKKEHKDEAKADLETAVQEEQGVPVPPVTHVNNILHSIFSIVEVYINNQENYNSNGLYAHKFYSSNNFKGAISEYNGLFRCKGYDYEEFLDEIQESLLS